MTIYFGWEGHRWWAEVDRPDGVCMFGHVGESLWELIADTIQYQIEIDEQDL